jgi:membrane-associated HD superfamily phosphohydrolase
MSENWWIILIIIAILIVWTFFRRKSTATPKLDSAIGLITDVNNNLRVIDSRQTEPASKKKFSDGNWRRYQDKLEFLDASLVSSLKETFTLVEEYNSKIEVAKKNNTLSTLQDLPLENLKGLLTTDKKGLADWLKANMQSELQNTKRRTWLGF